jgi:hypothetical protein
VATAICVLAMLSSWPECLEAGMKAAMLITR